MVAAVDAVGVPSESLKCRSRWQAALDLCRANPSFSKTARGNHGQATPGRSFFLLMSSDSIEQSVLGTPGRKSASSHL